MESNRTREEKKQILSISRTKDGSKVDGDIANAVNRVCVVLRRFGS